MGLFDRDYMRPDDDRPPLTDEEMQRMAENIMAKIGRYRVCPVCVGDVGLFVRISARVFLYDDCPLCQSTGAIRVIKQRPTQRGR